MVPYSFVRMCVCMCTVFVWVGWSIITIVISPLQRIMLCIKDLIYFFLPWNILVLPSVPDVLLVKTVEAGETEEHCKWRTESVFMSLYRVVILMLHFN